MAHHLSPDSAGALSALRELWGFADFRPGQRQIVTAVLRGRDLLATLPTGGGKSLCFQVPAILLPGTMLVVSPLISLMQDQVAALQRRGIAAAYLSSSQPQKTQDASWELFRTRRLKLLYVAPERLGRIVERKGSVSISRLAIDEAHCISEWGHDFRPHYRALGFHRFHLGFPPTIALTATASPATRDDIVKVARLRRAVNVLQSFDRPNLHFGAERFGEDPVRLRRALSLLRATDQTSIVYVPTRNRTDGVAAVLRRFGFRAAPYHAGLPGSARRSLLSAFMDGRIKVMVATSAFGMGIDKPDVRTVIHLGVPTRPEAYYQEAGRAGRDGAPAHCHLLWTDADLRLAVSMAGLRPPSRSRQARDLARVRRHAVATMRHYVRTRRCRRAVLLGYLGERLDSCSGCDRCSGSRAP
jgi:ATP-dependent DNA helicase RecQ